MPVTFDNIPANLRTPGVYIEFNNELAAANTPEFKILVLGQKLTAGTIAQNIPTRVSRKSDAETYYGRGSMLASMIASLLDASRDIEVWAIAQDDNGAGVAATGTIAFTGPATKAGTVYLYVAGTRLAVAVANADTATVVGAAVAAAVNADTSLPVTAANVTGTVTFTARNKGTNGNDIDLRLNYYDGEALPTGITAVVTAMASGATNPVLTSTIAAFGETWWNWIVNPYTDTTSLVALEAELNTRWGPTVQKGARAFSAHRGTPSASATFGNARNSPHVTCIGTGISPTPSYIWAAVNAAIAARSLSIDPARPLQSLVLPGVLPPKLTERWLQSERNTALYDGTSTHTVDVDGTVRIERQITMYQTNSGGIADASYLDINTPETLERVRFAQRARISQSFPRHKLAADGTQYGAGQSIVTPRIIKAELLALYRTMELNGWVEGFDNYKSTIVVEIDAADANRINVSDQPNLVNQFRIHAQNTKFIV